MLGRLILTALMAACIACAPAGQTKTDALIDVSVFKGEVATVNSYIFSNGQSLIVMDVQRATSEAKKLAAVIKSTGLPLEYILVSHGHPDHYIGMDWLLKEFPKAIVVVANENVKTDIIGFSTWMESIGWLDAEPALKPKSEKNPDGFDYDRLVTVLDSDELEFSGGGSLKLETHYKPAESDHATTIYVEDINSLFSSDFGYNKVHLWMGSGVTDEHISNWKTQLGGFQTKYGALNPTVYPGHGEPSTVELFGTLVKYIDDFQRIIVDASSKEDAMAEMEKLYPDYGEADFLLKNSVDFHFQQ